MARGAAETAEEKFLNDITGGVVDAAYKVHQGLGPGLLESVYEAVLARDLARRGYTVERQRSLSFEYDGMVFNDVLRIDLLIEQCVVVEIKSAERHLPIYFKQTLTYLRLLHLPVGLLINFGMPLFKEGIHRVVNSRALCGSAALRAQISGSALPKPEDRP